MYYKITEGAITMKKNFKRLISLLLIISMALSFVGCKGAEEVQKDVEDVEEWFIVNKKLDYINHK